jgi:hypothetical protein
MTGLKHFPALPLSEVVELFWYSARDTTPVHGTAREAILPDGCAHLVINLSENRIRLYEQIESNRLTTLDGSIFSGPRSSPYAFLPAASAVIGVVFRPGGVFRLLSVPTDEFRNTQVPLELVGGGGLARSTDRRSNAGGQVPSIGDISSSPAPAISITPPRGQVRCESVRTRFLSIRCSRAGEDRIE